MGAVAPPVAPTPARANEAKPCGPGTPAAWFDVGDVVATVEGVALAPARAVEAPPGPAVAAPVVAAASAVPAAGLVALAAVPVVIADVLVVPADGDPTRRRTGDAAERIDGPAADAPPAAATTVGAMRRRACPGPAMSLCCSLPAAPLASARPHPPAVDGFAGLRDPAPDGFAGLRVPAPDGFAGLRDPAPNAFAGLRVPAPDGFAGLRDPAPDGFAGLGVPAPDGFAGLRESAPDGFAGLRVPAVDEFAGFHAPVAALADAYAAAAPMGGAEKPRWSRTGAAPAPTDRRTSTPSMPSPNPDGRVR
ncbi:hypothetical protein ASD16_11925 [Cellulomonas sp. Root485]|uniref:hypothetical protein n=1 Tax=Cellulomonas sp. Root485 TaxID=1736546 RepID=UPI000700B7EE|nr:hypothetical protein [Cellulomonas sp. Root485]KQY23258.1 hypothetical protein ASD16_11925 [Cellulomonas sp. Root485]